MFLFSLALFALSASAASATCVAGNGKNCLSKSEVPSGYGYMFATGDPCFSSGGNNWCIYEVTVVGSSSSAKMSSCNCAAGGGAAPAPAPSTGSSNTGSAGSGACDNSAVPTSFDCAADKTTFCAIATDHTMCKYCELNAAKCGKVCTRGVLTSADKQSVIDEHNRLRRIVAKGQETRGVNGGQPAAADMFELKWSDELAKVAQRWTDQCTWNHDTNRNTPKYSWVGQNMAMSMSSGPQTTNYKNHIAGWYDEVKDFPGANVSPYTGSNGATGTVGHYTALAWGSTKEVGCGIVSFEKTGESYPYQTHFICNYGPGGNFNAGSAGAKMYATGAAGSACPSGSNDGLCTW